MGRNMRIHNFIFQDATKENSDGNILSIGINSVLATVEITGSGSNAVIFEGKAFSDGDYYPIMGVNLKDLSMTTETTNKGAVYQLSLEGLVSFRIRVKDYISGEVSVKGTVVD